MDSHPIIFGFPVRYGHYLYFSVSIFIFGFPVSSRSLVVTSNEPFRLPTSHLASGPTVPLQHNRIKTTGPEFPWSTAKICRFQLRSLSTSSAEQLAVTPPEFPSPTSEIMDSPTDETQLRLAELENKLVSQQAKNDQVLDALNSTLRLLAGMTQNQAHPPTTATHPTTSAVKTKTDLKPSPPPNFDGDRHKGRGFINACQAYF